MQLANRLVRVKADQVNRQTFMKTHAAEAIQLAVNELH